jgi:hypothetical protein
LLHHAQAPPGGFQLQNKGTREHDLIALIVLIVLIVLIAFDGSVIHSIFS